MKPIIKVEKLGKQYQLGEARKPYLTLRESLVETFKSPFKKFRETSEENKFWALKDVSFEIQPGEVFGIIGRNGAGKSTLLKVLSRITEPTKGRVELYGRVASLLEVGTGFHAELTGRENIFLNGAILGMKREEISRKFDEIVDFAEIEKFIDTPVKHYSSGMYVRLAFAVASSLEPEILIIDEVLAVGDIQFQKKCLGKMNNLANTGRTVLFVSHNIEVVNALCNNTLYLSNGEINAQGVTEKIIKKYFRDSLLDQEQDINRLRSPGLGEKVHFTGIKMVSEVNHLQFGTPISYELSILSNCDIDGLSVGSSFFNSSGNIIGTLITNEFSIKSEQQSTFILTVSNLSLSPGSYYTGFSIGFGEKEGTRKDLDRIVGIPRFEIIPSQNSSLEIASWHPNWGSIVFKDISFSQIDK